jgi:hypothetical protein
MLHYSPAKKNEHQNDHVAFPELYLYSDHKISKNVSNHLSQEMRDELDNDIFYMRRNFKRSIKKLNRTIDYTNWLKNLPESDRFSERMRLRSRHA